MDKPKYMLCIFFFVIVFFYAFVIMFDREGKK